MRFMKIMLVLAVCVLGLSVLASAGQNQFGVADTRQIKFDSPTWVGGTLLPSGNTHHGLRAEGWEKAGGSKRKVHVGTVAGEGLERRGDVHPQR
jgi:hypothetical protein